MNPTIEELSDFWQDVLYVRCKGNSAKAMEYLVAQYSLWPNSSTGRYALALLKHLGKEHILLKARRNGNMKWR